jgi:hypothetical protein
VRRYRNTPFARSQLTPVDRDKLSDMPPRGRDELRTEQSQQSWPQIPESLDPHRTMSGPLVTAMIGMFSEHSLLAKANSTANVTDTAKPMCTSARLPFFRLHGFERYEKPCSQLTGNNEEDDEALASIMLTFLNATFNSRYLSEVERHVSTAVYVLKP